MTPYTPPPTKDDLAPKARWRTGRHVGRTIYAQPGPEPDRAADVLIGVMDTPALAELVVTAVNARLADRLDSEQRPGAADVLCGASAATSAAAEQQTRLGAGTNWPALWRSLNGYVDGDDDPLDAKGLRAYMADLYEQHVAAPRRAAFATEFGTGSTA